MINHWLDDAQSFFQTPNVLLLNTTNSAETGTVGTLATQARQCASEWSVKPTFLLVNFFNVGPAIATVDQMNGVTGVGRMKLSTGLLTASSGSGSIRLKVGGRGSGLMIALGVVALAHLW